MEVMDQKRQAFIFKIVLGWCASHIYVPTTTKRRENTSHQWVDKIIGHLDAILSLNPLAQWGWNKE